MVKKTAMMAIGILFFISSAPVMADEFSISFEWGDIPLCASGHPNTVKNPKFILSNVPKGTKIISFSLKDLDAPNYMVPRKMNEVLKNGLNLNFISAYNYK